MIKNVKQTGTPTPYTYGPLHLLHSNVLIHSMCLFFTIHAHAHYCNPMYTCGTRLVSRTIRTEQVRGSCSTSTVRLMSVLIGESPCESQVSRPRS